MINFGFETGAIMDFFKVELLQPAIPTVFQIENRLDKLTLNGFNLITCSYCLRILKQISYVLGVS